MVLYQFVWTSKTQTAAPLTCEVTHHFSGKRVRMRLIHWTNISRTSQAYPSQLRPTDCLRVDFIGGLQTNTGTALGTYNPDGLVTNSTSGGFYFPNFYSDQALHGWEVEGYCLGNAWTVQLQLSTLAPRASTTAIPDILQQINQCILTVDVVEL